VEDHILYLHLLFPYHQPFLVSSPVYNLLLCQIMEELENLEETLNDSVRESLGARSGKAKRGNHKAILEEEDVLRFVN
jgi:hypothetical protein